MDEPLIESADFGRPNNDESRGSHVSPRDGLGTGKYLFIETHDDILSDDDEAGGFDDTRAEVQVDHGIMH